MKLLLEEHWLEVSIGTLVKLLDYIIIISIGPVIESVVIPTDYTVVNADNYKEGVTEIDLPIISTENGPFRLVGDRYITNSFSFIISTM